MEGYWSDEAARIASLAADSTMLMGSCIGRWTSAPAARMWPPPPNVAHSAAASTGPRLRTLILVSESFTSLNRMASSSPAMLLSVSMMPSDSAITAFASFSIRRVTLAHASLPSSSTRMVASANPFSLRVVYVDDRRVRRDLLDALPRTLQVPRIEEKDQLRVDAMRRFGPDLGEPRHEGVHVRQGRWDEHPDVLARAAQRLREREAASERVPVGVFVPEDQDLLVGVDQLLDLVVNMRCLLRSGYDGSSGALSAGSTSFNNPDICTAHSPHASPPTPRSPHTSSFLPRRPTPSPNTPRP